MNGLALAVVAVGSGLQVALYLHRFGTNHRTDGFIAAFAVYSLVVVIAQILRTTAVPLVSGARPRVTRAQFGWAVTIVSLCVTAVFGGLAEPLARVLTSSSGPQARSVAITSLLVMAPAMGLQMAAAGLSVAGGLRGDLVRVALAYAASAATGLIAFFALAGATHERVLAYTMLVSSATLVTVLLLDVRPRLTAPPPLRAVIATAALVLRTAPIPASFVVMYPITLGLVPTVRAGTITIFGLAFTACSYLVGATGQALSMVRVFAFTALDEGADDKRRGLVTRAFRYSMLIAVPGLAVGILAGQPIVRALLASRAHGRAGFATDLLLLIPWMIATLGLWATLPAVLARTQAHGGTQTAKIVAALLAVHVGVALLGRALWGLNGLILALAAAPTTFTIIGAWELGPGARQDFGRDGILVVGAAAAAFGAIALPIRTLIGGGAAAGIVSALVGTVVYACFVLAAVSAVGRSALGHVRH